MPRTELCSICFHVEASLTSQKMRTAIVELKLPRMIRMLFRYRTIRGRKWVSDNIKQMSRWALPPLRKRLNFCWKCQLGQSSFLASLFEHNRDASRRILVNEKEPTDLPEGHRTHPSMNFVFDCLDFHRGRWRKYLWTTHSPNPIHCSADHWIDWQATNNEEKPEMH